MPQSHRILIPPQSGQAIRVKRGDMVRIIDPQGQQVADLWAFAVDGAKLDWLSTSQTRNVTERLFPQVGESFFSAREVEPMLTLIEDASPGPHENISIDFVPDPVDLFQNSLPQPDGRIDVLTSVNPPGAYVKLRAERDLLLVVTACSVDFHPTNGGRCTEIEVEVTGSDGADGTAR